MRIADKMNYDQVTSNLAKNRSEMSDLQNQAATQKRVTKPSDDPLAAARVLAGKVDIHSNNQFLKSVNSAKNFLEYSEQSLSELADVINRAKELALAQSSDASANEGTRAIVATEIAQLKDQMIQIGNRKMGDRYLFAGFKTNRPPFDRHGNYAGDDGEMQIIINKDAAVAMNIPGSKVFMGKSAAASAVGAESHASPYPPGIERKDQGIQPGRPVEWRGPASENPQQTQEEVNLSDSWKSGGTNVFDVFADLEVALKANDKAGVQDSLDSLDAALAQAVLARSSLGSRVATLNSATETLSKAQVDNKTMVSNLEDADTFQLVSDINKTDSTLKATLASSGKLIQPSLLDFLR
jgi:flagellar hook-associated protein 3 FlgL